MNGEVIIKENLYNNNEFTLILPAKEIIIGSNCISIPIKKNELKCLVNAAREFIYKSESINSELRAELTALEDEIDKNAETQREKVLCMIKKLEKARDDAE